MQRAGAVATLCLAFIYIQYTHGASLSVIQRLESLWGNIAFSAAEATIKVVEQNTGRQLTLRDVPLETFKVFIGRQHHLGVEVDGVDYQVALNSELDLKNEVKALPELEGTGTGLVGANWWQLKKGGGIPLPDITLAGPLELMLPRSMPISAYLPHSADVGEARRVILAAGAVITIKGLKALTLRRPIELPRLPMQYLAEVYAHVKLGEPEEGFEQAPGILYLSKELRSAAANLSAGDVLQKQKTRANLLSFEAEPLAGALTLMAAAEQPGVAAQKLKAKRLQDGTLEITARQAVSSASSDALLPISTPWAWPLPGIPLTHWVPYESLLRSILGSHPFDLKRVQQQGVGLKLKKSSLRGISLISFDMHVRGSLPQELKAAEAREQEEGGDTGLPTRSDLGPLEVWEVTVQLKDVEGGGWEYHPVTAKQKEAYYNTVTVSDTAHDALTGNTSVPLGYDHFDEGVARNAP